jgi:hypothetical protein
MVVIGTLTIRLGLNPYVLGTHSLILRIPVIGIRSNEIFSFLGLIFENLFKD